MGYQSIPSLSAIADCPAKSPANPPFLKGISVLPTISVDNSVDKIGGDVPKVVSCKAFSCAAYFLTS
jgi:hypothetical protein